MGSSASGSIGLASNGLDMAAIHPSNGEKYSPNLYRWLANRERKHRAWTSRVYHDDAGVLWIGRFDLSDFIGARLYGVLCNGTKEGSGCMIGLRGLVEVTDFWARYVRDGRCAIDTEHERHFFGDRMRWAVNGDARTCLWCGRVTQSLRRWTEFVERQAWRNDGAINQVRKLLHDQEPLGAEFEAVWDANTGELYES